MDEHNCRNLIDSLDLTTDQQLALTEYLARLYPDTAQKAILRSLHKPTPADVVRIICAIYGTYPTVLAAPGGKRENDLVARCRATVIDILNTPFLYGLSRKVISDRFLGHRDNSTMIYIWRNHGVWDDVYRSALYRVCILLSKDYHETLASLEEIHASRGTTNRRNARTARL